MYTFSLMLFLIQLRSLSLSLDSLLDYTDKDIEESTLEVCIHAFIYFSLQHFFLSFTYRAVADSEWTSLFLVCCFCSFHCLPNHFMKCFSIKWVVKF